MKIAMLQTGLVVDEVKHIAHLNGYRLLSITEVLRLEGIVDPRYYTNAGRIRGRNVHLLTQLIDQGTLDWADLKAKRPKMVPYADAYQEFRRYYPLRSEFEKIELTMVDEAYGLWGTPDRFDPVYIWEYKSGSMPEWAELQTGGYDRLAQVNFPTLKPRQRIGVELKPNGTFKLHEFKTRSDQQLFLGMVASVRWHIQKGIIRLNAEGLYERRK